MDLVKQQHYVWKEYLRNWSNKDKIFTFYKNSNKIENTSLNQIAKQRFFYKLNKFSDLEILFLKNIINSSPTPVKNLQEELLMNIIRFGELEEIYKKNNDSNSNTFKNGLEPIHTIIESLGKNLIKCRSIEELKLLENEFEKTNALMFLCVQYCRTKKRRDDIKINKIANQEFLDFDKMFSFLSIIMGMNIGFNSSINENLYFELLTNSSEYGFITSDQPVINLLSEIKDENNNVKDLLLYYPLSHNYALRIGFRNNSKKYSEHHLGTSEVNELNIQLLKHSNLYVFSENEITLKKATHNTG